MKEELLYTLWMTPRQFTRRKLEYVENVVKDILDNSEVDLIFNQELLTCDIKNLFPRVYTTVTLPKGELITKRSRVHYRYVDYILPSLHILKNNILTINEKEVSQIWHKGEKWLSTLNIIQTCQYLKKKFKINLTYNILIFTFPRRDHLQIYRTTFGTKKASHKHMKALY